MTRTAEHDGAQVLDAGIVVLPLRTPTLPPATSTNTMLVGTSTFVVIEPATPYADEQKRLCDTIDARISEGGCLRAVLVTHHHRDHVGFAAELAERYAVPVAAHPETARRAKLTSWCPLLDGESIELDRGRRVSAVHTPGHAPGHLVFVDSTSRIAHAGDMVAGIGFVIVDPSDHGDMAAYMASLERLLALETSLLVPAHGPVIADPKACITVYLGHRRDRERRIVAALATMPATLDGLLPRAYADTPKALWPIARKSLLAHLVKLEDEGVVVRRAHGFALADPVLATAREANERSGP